MEQSSKHEDTRQSDTVFISYSRKDFLFVTQIVNRLLSCGINVWMDKRNLVAGTSWIKQIGVSLDSSSVMLLFVSSNSMASSNVEDEWIHFKPSNKPIITIFWNPEDKPNIPYPLEKYQNVDFREGSSEEAFSKLIHALESHGISCSNDNMGVNVAPTILPSPIQTVSAELSKGPPIDEEPASDLPQQSEASLTASPEPSAESIKLSATKTEEERNNGGGWKKYRLILLVVVIVLLVLGGLYAISRNNTDTPTISESDATTATSQSERAATLSALRTAAAAATQSSTVTALTATPTASATGNLISTIGAYATQTAAARLATETTRATATLMPTSTDDSVATLNVLRTQSAHATETAVAH